MFTSSQYVREKNQDATIYVGNITDQANEELLWELFLQVRILGDPALARFPSGGARGDFLCVLLESLQVGRSWPLGQPWRPVDELLDSWRGTREQLGQHRGLRGSCAAGVAAPAAGRH